MSKSYYIRRDDDSVAFCNGDAVFAIRRDGVWRWAEGTETDGDLLSASAQSVYERGYQRDLKAGAVR